MTHFKEPWFILWVSRDNFVRKRELPAFRPMKAGPVPSSNKHITKITLPYEWMSPMRSQQHLIKKLIAKPLRGKAWWDFSEVHRGCEPVSKCQVCVSHLWISLLPWLSYLLSQWGQRARGNQSAKKVPRVSHKNSSVCEQLRAVPVALNFSACRLKLLQ